MHNLLRYIRMNKSKLIKVALIAAFLIIVLQILNYLAGKNNSIEYSEDYSNIKNETNGTIKSDKSAVSGTRVSESEIKEVGNIINTFVDYCNSEEIDKAYELLSQECKDILYNNLDSFRETYYNRIFNNRNRTYTIENWTGNIYMVKFTEDLLSTGKAINNSSYTDYITIIDENGEKKLNINSLIGIKEINKEKTENDIKVKVLNSKKYMEYEEYEIEVTNYTNSTILLDTLSDSKGIYIKDNKDNRHYAYKNELSKEDMKVFSKNSKKFKIKFDNPYITGRNIKTLCISNIVLNYVEENYGASFKAKVSVDI